MPYSEIRLQVNNVHVAYRIKSWLSNHFYGDIRQTSRIQVTRYLLKQNVCFWSPLYLCAFKSSAHKAPGTCSHSTPIYHIISLFRHQEEMHLEYLGICVNFCCFPFMLSYILVTLLFVLQHNVNSRIHFNGKERWITGSLGFFGGLFDLKEPTWCSACWEQGLLYMVRWNVTVERCAGGHTASRHHQTPCGLL